MQLLHGGGAEQGPNLRKEVGNRVHAVVVAELELLLAVRRDDVDLDERLAGELLHDRAELADQARPERPGRRP